MSKHWTECKENPHLLAIRLRLRDKRVARMIASGSVKKRYNVSRQRRTKAGTRSPAALDLMALWAGKDA